MELGQELDGLRSNYLRKQPSIAGACGYTGSIAGEAGDVEEPPHTAAGQHRTTRSTSHKPRSVLSRAGFVIGHEAIA